MTGGSFTAVSYLTKQENVELEKGLERLKSVGGAASVRELRLLIDGEYTYLNRAISIAALSMAGAFNQSRPVVWNTYQCYLKVLSVFCASVSFYCIEQLKQLDLLLFRMLSIKYAVNMKLLDEWE